MYIDKLDAPSVLVLNRNWQAIFVRTPRAAFPMLVANVSTALDIDEDNMVPVKWEDWIKLPIRPQDDVIHTPRQSIRIPTVMVLATFNKVPKKRPTFSPKAVWARDQGVCQYTGRRLAPGEGNLDHVHPRSRGGATDWENCVLAAKDVNSRKGDKTLEEAGLTLIRQPVVPKEVPVTILIKNPGIADWQHFLS